MKHGHDVRRAVGWMVLLLMGFLYTPAPAQEEGRSEQVGVTQDWTQGQLIFSLDGLILHPELMMREPRILHQVMQRWAGSGASSFHRPETAQDSSPTAAGRDWNFALGGGRLAPFMFPAKYSMNPDAPPDCTNDYVVFALNTRGATGGQANLVGLNNLYSGTGGSCTGPIVYFAYNVSQLTGGRIATSPAISVDGKKIAFVETTANAAVFHVLTWTPNTGGIQNAAPPNMTSLTFAAAGSTRSSPWVDYSTDTAYVGADDGKVYKFTGVFKGTPALAGGFWPVTIGTASFPLLTPPVLDSSRGLLMVGNGNGDLYSINISTGVVKSGAVGLFHGFNAGVLAPPIVDVTNGTTFAISANDGTSAVLVEFDSATLTQLAKARIGVGAATGTDLKLYQPAFDNNYFSKPSTGKARLCGTGANDATPWQYAFGFDTGTPPKLIAAPVFSKQLLNSTTARCTGWTEFFNKNINGGTDYFFFGLLLDCGNGNTGCVVERLSDTQLLFANVNDGPSGVIIDNERTDNPQTSNIYLTNQHAPNRAYKFTQNGLQ